MIIEWRNRSQIWVHRKTLKKSTQKSSGLRPYQSKIDFEDGLNISENFIFSNLA